VRITLQGLVPIRHIPAVKRRHFAVLVAAGVISALTLPFRAAAQDEFAVDAARLARALELAAGQTVGDIGAGSGELTVELARMVGRTGRLYATELESDKLRAIRRAADKAELKNVTVVEAHATRTNLQDRCCDALVMRLVYHHIKNPSLMNQSLYGSLKPGGRLAIIDFPPDGEESTDPSRRADGGHHGVTSRTAIRELRQAGFELVTVDEGSGSRRYMVVMRRPYKVNFERQR
jgi:tRNA A58 N-methylase Trm61